MLANLKLEAVSYTKSNLTTVFSVLPVQEGGRGGREWGSFRSTSLWSPSMPAKCLVKVHKTSRTKTTTTKLDEHLFYTQSNPTYYFDFHNSAHEPRATCSILEARTNVTKKNERILIKDLISYKLKHRTKEARLILQSGIYNFCYQYFGQHGLVLFM